MKNLAGDLQIRENERTWCTNLSNSSYIMLQHDIDPALFLELAYAFFGKVVQSHNSTTTMPV